MPSEGIHVGDVGVVFEVTVKDDEVVVDVSSATTKQVWLSPPEGKGATQKTDAAFKTDGTDGILQYTTLEASELSVSGIWKLQAYLVMSTGIFHSEIVEFEVRRNL